MSTPLSDSNLLMYNQLGIIPGPSENEEDFCARADVCLNLRVLLAKNNDIQLPFEIDSTNNGELLPSAFPQTKTLFDIQPSWLPIVFSNYQLTPWHGGCAWIFQLETNGPKTAFLQLRKAFALNENYLKIYSRNELVTHECAHIGRMLFNEESFEEVLAYRSSTSAWRRWWGPLVQSATESFLFMLLLAVLIGLDLFFILTQNHENYFTLFWLKLLPLGVLLLGILRLWRRQNTFLKCLQQLELTLKNQTIANHVIYRLTDKEIISFAKMTSEEIVEYSKNHQGHSLRWKLLNLAYFAH